MKKWLPVCIVLCCVFLGSTEVYGEQESTLKEDVSSTERIQVENKKQITKEFIGRGNVEKDRERQRRSLRYSSLETSGLYANQGDSLSVEVSGQDSLELVIGTPERDEQKKYSLNQGTNLIEVENKGSIYITNPNEDGSTVVTISGATGSMPYFDLNTTDVKEFQKQMSTEVNAADVQLVSNKAIVTVSYGQAKKNIKNPKGLMEYYDKFLMAQDRVSGITNSGKAENLVDRHFQHFVEVSRMYMFATHEYMGFNGDIAVSKLMKADHNNNDNWGIWHESGHQRQQTPWKWESVTESTVNIYSLAAQKETTGSLSNMNRFYPQMRTYLKSENNDFEAQNNDIKMMLFGQLGNTFGDDFYPTLHQYYRENKLSYVTDTERIQNFMLNASKITGYNLIPYFEKWGFAIEDLTRKQTSQLLVLPEKIWLNDNRINKKLPIKLINKTTLSDENIKVDLTEVENNIFQGQKIVISKNNEYVSELTNKVPYYSYLNDNIWKTNISLAPTDSIRIEVRTSAGTYQLYKGSMIVDQLRNKMLDYLNSEDKLSEILTQATLDGIRSEIGKIADKDDKKTLSDLLETLEAEYLESLVKGLTLDENGDLVVEFSNSKFMEYNKVVVLGTGKYIAEVANGISYYSDLVDNTLKVYEQENQSEFSVQFRLPHKIYTVSEVDKEGLILKNDIENLFTANNQLKEDVTQEKLDNLRTRISLLSKKLKGELTTRINYAQQLFFELMISELDFNDSEVTISFSNELYKNYKVVVLGDKKYVAELTNGQPYYGKIDGLLFTTTGKANPGSLYEVEVRHSSGNYKIKEKIFN